MEGRDLLLGVISFGIGTLFFILSSQLDPMPGIFPKIISVILQLLGLFKISVQISLLVRVSEARKSFVNGIRSIQWTRELRIAFPLLIAIIYSLLFKKIGFALLTPITIFIIGFFFGYRKYLVLILTSLGFSLVLYLLFGLFLNVPIPMLPKGV